MVPTCDLVSPRPSASLCIVAALAGPGQRSPSWRSGSSCCSLRVPPQGCSRSLPQPWPDPLHCDPLLSPQCPLLYQPRACPTLALSHMSPAWCDTPGSSNTTGDSPSGCSHLTRVPFCWSCCLIFPSSPQSSSFPFGVPPLTEPPR